MTNLYAMILQTDAQMASSGNPPVWQHMSDALFQSLYRVLSLFIAVLPGILAFFVALGLFTAVGMAISALLRWLLKTTKFDDRLFHERGADWTPSSSPAEMVARASFWACVLLGLIIGVSAFDTSYATAATLPMSLLPYLTRAIGAILLLFFGNLWRDSWRERC